ncbi:hypothetical protein B2G74_00525 [Burkholderia sp. A27]|nr:hypothetical protein B2G74_00525 [Burkholderia sp. A27]
MPMKAAGTLYFAAMVALAVSAGYGAQSACFIEVLTTVGKASELPLERIAADNAMERVIEDGARSLEGVRHFLSDLVSWQNEKTQAIPNGCIG